MKKILLLVLVIFIVVIISPLIFIPNNIKITKVGVLAANKRTTYRCLTQNDLMQKYLKSADKNELSVKDLSFINNKVKFQFKPGVLDVIQVDINQKGEELKSVIALSEITADSTAVEWSTNLISSKNPLKRIQQYFHAQKIHESMANILASLQEFVIKKENIYGLSVQRALVTDTLLVTTKTTTKEYPKKEFYYDLIKKLQNYIGDQKAASVNYPMLNITPLGDNQYAVTVAVPVNKALPDNNSIAFKRMIPGNILIAEVKGGTLTIENAIINLSNYAADYQLVAPAIPYQSLITDRLMEPDSSKWVTKLYFPIY